MRGTTEDFSTSPPIAALSFSLILSRLKEVCCLELACVLYITCRVVRHSWLSLSPVSWLWLVTALKGGVRCNFFSLFSVLSTLKRCASASYRLGRDMAGVAASHPRPARESSCPTCSFLPVAWFLGACSCSCLGWCFPAIPRFSIQVQVRSRRS